MLIYSLLTDTPSTHSTKTLKEVQSSSGFSLDFLSAADPGGYNPHVYMKLKEENAFIN